MSSVDVLHGALNGGLSKSDHSGVPVTCEELAQDAQASSQEGAEAFHIHPRDKEGRETLDPETIDRTVNEVKKASGCQVGVSTGAWILPDTRRRVALIQKWKAPDFATVNLSEAGSADVMNALYSAGIGIEAAIWKPEDAERLNASGMSDEVLRVYVEPQGVGAQSAVSFVSGIHDELDRLGMNAPRLQHGDGEAAWILLEDAVRRGLDTRIGLEDTLRLPNERVASDNSELVRETFSMCQRHPRK